MQASRGRARTVAHKFRIIQNTPCSQNPDSLPNVLLDHDPPLTRDTNLGNSFWTSAIPQRFKVSIRTCRSLFDLDFEGGHVCLIVDWSVIFRLEGRGGQGGGSVERPCSAEFTIRVHFEVCVCPLSLNLQPAQGENRISSHQRIPLSLDLSTLPRMCGRGGRGMHCRCCACLSE